MMTLLCERRWKIAAGAVEYLLIACGCAFAQNGAVTGRAFASDSNLPCRFVNVMLQGVNMKDGDMDGKMYAAATDLDGSYSISNVAPGKYYLYGEAPGYISPIATMNSDVSDDKKAEARRQFEQKLTTVTVEANLTATANLVLERGAAIGGQVTYDDGSPAAGVSVDLFRKESDGAWKIVSVDVKSLYSLMQLARFTDDRGYYRIAGLPAGTYVVRTVLPMLTLLPQGPFARAGMAMYKHPQGALQVYSGNAMRLRNATPLTVGAGEQQEGDDITIPLSGLHRIRGSVSALGDGHGVPLGKVELLDPDDKTSLRTADLEHDGSFSFDAVPVGNYIVSLSELTEGESKSAAHYRAVQKALIVQSDVGDMDFTVEAEKGH